MKCAMCRLNADQIDYVVKNAKDYRITPDKWIQHEEGTYSPETDSFLCDECYIKAGMPSSPQGWTATHKNLTRLATELELM